MGAVLKAEHLKWKRTFGKYLPVIGPAITLFSALALGGMAKTFSAGAWNWWYAALLPGTLAVMCYLCDSRDRKNRYHSLKGLPVSGGKLMLGKVVYLSLGLSASNGVLFLGTALGDAVFGSTVSLGNGALAAVLLTLSFLWEIPLYLFLSARFGLFADIFASMVISFGSVAAVADKNCWWVFPSAIPVRLMCPVLGLHPNGLPLPDGSALCSTDVILPGVFLSLGWFLVCAGLLGLWFEKREAA